MVHDEFHLGEDLGDMSFSQVPLDLMEHIARVAAGHSMGRDVPGLISNQVFGLIQQIAGQQDALVRMPRGDMFGNPRRMRYPPRPPEFSVFQGSRDPLRLGQ